MIAFLTFSAHPDTNKRTKFTLMSSKKAPQPKVAGTNWPGMIRDVLVASLNKGQFPLALVFVIFIIIFCRLPEADLSKFVFDFWNKCERFYVIGWILFGVTLFGWYFNTRYIRKNHAQEMHRIAEEKKYLQEQLTNRKIPSSNAK